MYIVCMSRVAVVKYIGGHDSGFLSRVQYRQLLEAGFQVLAGVSDYTGYVRRLFPGDVVGMKANCLTAFNSTMLPLTEALSDILVEAAGIGENNIVIWERTNRELKNAGFTLNASSFGRRCLGTDAAGIGYDDGDFHRSGRVSSLVTRILTRLVDHNINLGVLKHHSIAGMSAGMKNMYGAVNNPNKYHGNNCSPFAADVNNLEPIRQKQRLVVVDAVRVQYDRGPGFIADALAYYNGLVVSEDPVAADRVALEVLEHVRRVNGKPLLADTGREVKYLPVAEKIGLGVGDMARIDLRVALVDGDGAVSEGKLF